MPQVINDVFPAEYLSQLTQLPEVATARDKLTDGPNSVFFSIIIPEPIKNVLAEKLGLNLSNIREVPMRWVQGDMPSHIDIGVGVFLNTHIVYLVGGLGEFIIDSQSSSNYK